MKNIGTIKVCGLAIQVKEGTDAECVGLKDAYACYDRDTMSVWVDRSVPKDKRAFWLVHEACHALLELSGALYTTSSALGMAREDARMAAWEETLIRLLTPHILETFGPARMGK